MNAPRSGARSIALCWLLASERPCTWAGAFSVKPWSWPGSGAAQLFPNVLITKKAPAPVLPPPVVSAFWDAYRRGHTVDLLDCIEDTVLWDDYDYGSACHGARALERRLRLERGAEPQTDRQPQLQLILTDDADPSCVGVTFVDEATGIRGCAILTLNNETNRIQRVEMVREQEHKGGEDKLQLLKRVSAVLPSQGSTSTSDRSASLERTADRNLVAQYFDAWNRRNMSEAVALFTEDVVYDDTAFPEPFAGKESLRKHLELCASVFLPSFEFRVDRTFVDSSRKCLMALWHVENDGTLLPYTRGCSVYQLDDDMNRIRTGLDFVEPNGPVKPRGSLATFARAMRLQFSKEPLRWIPAATWLAYMYVVFLSDGILPGANALALEPRTWKEVADLSLNFFLVAPLLHLPFSPSVHPMLEGVFNALLAWAALFAGFLSDDRREKPNWLPLLPTVAGMQLLTSAFLLPYLVTRTSEAAASSSVPLTKQDVTPATRLAGESRWLGPVLGGVGLESALWAVLGRPDDGYGTTLLERCETFAQLLSIDRVGSSFLVDLAIFAAFQGWLIDDDWKRRGGSSGGVGAWMTAVGKYVPLFGLAVYLTLRPSLPEE